MVDLKAKEETFKEELDLIFDESVKEFARLCVISAQDYFFIDCPASSTGKYHPLDELSWDGTIIHTKKVVTVAYDLCRGLNCEENRDEIIAACIIHDLRKKGETNSTGHTLRNHPDLGAKLVDQVQNETGILTEQSYQIIRNSVGYHYGPWSTKPWVKPLSAYTPEEMCVYLSDYTASKRCISVNYRRGNGI
jgi:23S rRNA maturation-related 3'-5' exoribonuclease YhaM